MLICLLLGSADSVEVLGRNLHEFRFAWIGRTRMACPAQKIIRQVAKWIAMRADMRPGGGELRVARPGAGGVSRNTDDHEGKGRRIGYTQKSEASNAGGSIFDFARRFLLDPPCALQHLHCDDTRINLDDHTAANTTSRIGTILLPFARTARCCSESKSLPSRPARHAVHQ